MGTGVKLATYSDRNDAPYSASSCCGVESAVFAAVGDHDASCNNDEFAIFTATDETVRGRC